MIWHIARREMTDKFMNAQFLAAGVIFLILFVLASAIGVAQYNELLDQYYANESSQLKRLERMPNFYAIANGPFNFHRKPEPLQALFKGVTRDLEGTYYYLSLIRDILALKGGYLSKSMARYFYAIDLAFIVGAFFSLLVFLFSYDAINSENQSGTLKLLLANSVSRSQVILGKLIGGFLSLSLPLLVSLSLAAAILILWADPSRLDCKALVLISAVMILYAAACYLAGIWASIVSKSPPSSLILVVFVWAFLFLGLPNVIGAYVIEKHPVGTFALLRELDAKEAEITRDWIQKMAPRYAAARKANDLLMYQQAINELDEEMISRNAERKNNYYLQRWFKQAELFRRLSLLSPAASFNEAALALAGSDVISEINYVRSIQSYIRNEYAPYLFRMQMEEIKRSPNRRRPQAVHPLDLSAMPGFRYQPEGLAVRLLRALPHAGALAFYCLLFFVLSYVAFLRLKVA